MKIVIQCAARKNGSAKTFHAADGSRVVFVARPDLAPPERGTVYARPDDAENGRSWRQRLVAYNFGKANPLGLLPACQLYAHAAYSALVEKFGMQKVFILSAGWGLIPANFLTPYYDVTFSASADAWKRRRVSDRYEDFCLMRDERDDIVFLGGKDYLPLFCKLTGALRGRKTVFFNSASRPDLPPGYGAVRFRTSTKTNWHYECARELIAGTIAPHA